MGIDCSIPRSRGIQEVVAPSRPRKVSLFRLPKASLLVYIFDHRIQSNGEKHLTQCFISSYLDEQDILPSQGKYKRKTKFTFAWNAIL